MRSKEKHEVENMKLLIAALRFFSDVALQDLTPLSSPAATSSGGWVSATRGGMGGNERRHI